MPGLPCGQWLTLLAIRVRTLFPYDGQRDVDLSFIENVVIEAHPAKDAQSPWWYGTLVKEGKKGWFPHTYVDELKRESVSHHRTIPYHTTIPISSRPYFNTLCISVAA